jgi:hypothetical protein
LRANKRSGRAGGTASLQTRWNKLAVKIRRKHEMKPKIANKSVGFIAILIFCVTAAAFLVLRVKAQTQTVDDLRSRLLEKGIPIDSLIVTKRIPFEIKIVIKSKSNDVNLQPDDLYYAQIVRKAATLFFRHGQKVNRYELAIVNAKGETVSWESNSIFPDELSQQSPSNVLSKLNDKDTTALLQTKLKVNGLSLDEIKVTSDQSLGDSGQELLLRISTPDINTANEYLLPFLGSLHNFLDEINSQYGTKITICWVIVYDQDKNQILNYVWDVETREETSIQAPGLGAWYPVPAPITTVTPTWIPNPTPEQNHSSSSGDQSYPPPEPTPTTQPYP